MPLRMAIANAAAKSRPVSRRSPTHATRRPDQPQMGSNPLNEGRGSIPGETLFATLGSQKDKKLKLDESSGRTSQPYRSRPHIFSTLWLGSLPVRVKVSNAHPNVGPICGQES